MGHAAYRALWLILWQSYGSLQDEAEELASGGMNAVPASSYARTLLKSTGMLVMLRK